MNEIIFVPELVWAQKYRSRKILCCYRELAFTAQHKIWSAAFSVKNLFLTELVN